MLRKSQPYSGKDNVNYSSKVSTDPVKRLTTISGKVPKTVNQNQEKTIACYSVAVVAVVAVHF